MRKVGREKFSTGSRGPILQYIHVGKCAGRSLWEAIKVSPVVSARFSVVHKVHVRRPTRRRADRYLIAVRNPISRALSAFNWRYWLVVETENQASRFPNEMRILRYYGNLNNLATGLYLSSGELDEAVARDFLSIHHLRENIDFYLGTLLPKIDASQIFGVVTTEFLAEESSALLGVDDLQRIHSHAPRVPNLMKNLDEGATRNLRRFLRPDFLVLEKLSEMVAMSNHSRTALLGQAQNV